MNSVYFDIYGCRIEIQSNEFVCKDLKVNIDFEFFSKEPNAQNTVAIVLTKLKDFKPKGIFIGQTNMCEVRQVSINARQLIYREKNTVLAVVEDNTKNSVRHITINAANPQVIDDILYFLINSVAGEHMDYSGLMRLHAFSFNKNNKTAIVHGPCKSGKSTLALEMIKNDEIKIYSDEISVIDLNKNILLPYPMRMASADIKPTDPSALKFTYFFNTKALLPINKKIIASPAKLTHFYTLSRSTPRPSYSTTLQLIAGVGLIQMWEYFLRLNNPRVLFKILLNRIKLVSYLAQLKWNNLSTKENLQEKVNLIS